MHLYLLQTNPVQTEYEIHSPNPNIHTTITSADFRDLNFKLQSHTHDGCCDIPIQIVKVFQTIEDILLT